MIATWDDSYSLESSYRLTYRQAQQNEAFIQPGFQTSGAADALKQMQTLQNIRTNIIHTMASYFLIIRME